MHTEDAHFDAPRQEPVEGHEEDCQARTNEQGGVFHQSRQGHGQQWQRIRRNTPTIISSRIVKQLNLQPYKQGGISGIGGATGSSM